jgi:hypothetical protein
MGANESTVVDEPSDIATCDFSWDRVGYCTWFLMFPAYLTDNQFTQCEKVYGCQMGRDGLEGNHRTIGAHKDSPESKKFPIPLPVQKNCFFGPVRILKLCNWPLACKTILQVNFSADTGLERDLSQMSTCVCSDFAHFFARYKNLFHTVTFSAD